MKEKLYDLGAEYAVMTGSGATVYGIFNEEAQYLETEEMWFENWDKAGPFWEMERTKSSRLDSE